MATLTTNIRTSTTSSSKYYNSVYLTSVSGLLKLSQLIVGAVCVGLVGSTHSVLLVFDSILYYLLIAVHCLIATFCLHISCVFSLNTASLISKTAYEIVYHCLSFILYVVAAIVLLVHVNEYRYPQKEYNIYMSAGIIGAINSFLYLLSGFWSIKAFRGS